MLRIYYPLPRLNQPQNTLIFSHFHEKNDTIEKIANIFTDILAHNPIYFTKYCDFYVVFLHLYTKNTVKIKHIDFSVKNPKK
jgi:hypothetical protein